MNDPRPSHPDASVKDVPSEDAIPKTGQSRRSPASLFSLRLSLREWIGGITVVALAFGLVLTTKQVRQLKDELAGYRRELGYLSKGPENQIAAARAPSDLPMTWKFRLRIPELKKNYRLAYSTLIRKDEKNPDWYGAVPLRKGESWVTIRILEDPRDKRWKIAAIVRDDSGTRRMGTTLPENHVFVFREPAQKLDQSVPRKTVFADSNQALRLADLRWLVGEGALMLYGDTPLRANQIGVFVEIQPDVGSL